MYPANFAQLAAECGLDERDYSNHATYDYPVITHDVFNSDDILGLFIPFHASSIMHIYAR